MSHIMQVKLESFVNGLFVIQPAYSEEEFGQLIQRALPPPFVEPYMGVYRDFSGSKSGSIFCDDKSPWVIVVFGSDPKLIRRRTLHEIVHLAKEIMHTAETRTRFIERVYTATKLP